MANDERYWSLADAELPSANTVAVALRCRSQSTYFYPTSGIKIRDQLYVCIVINK